MALPESMGKAVLAGKEALQAATGTLGIFLAVSAALAGVRDRTGRAAEANKAPTSRRP